MKAKAFDGLREISERSNVSKIELESSSGNKITIIEKEKGAFWIQGAGMGKMVIKPFAGNVILIGRTEDFRG